MDTTKTATLSVQSRLRCATSLRALVVLFSVLGTTSLVQASINEGLEAYFPLDGSADDASGNGNHGIAFGGVTFEDSYRGQAARFNGSTSFIQVQNAAIGNLGTDATLSFWFLADPGNVPGSRIFEKDDRAYWWFYAGADYVVLDVREIQSYGPPQWHLVGNTPEQTSTAWTAVALRKTGTTLDLFINGQLSQSVADAANSVVTTAPMTLGRSYYWNNFYYSGLVDEVRVYDRALTASEIAQIAAIPEPSTVVLLLAGLSAVGWRARATRSDA